MEGGALSALCLATLAIAERRLVACGERQNKPGSVSSDQRKTATTCFESGPPVEEAGLCGVLELLELEDEAG